jgi:hypothetical protein
MSSGTSGYSPPSVDSGESNGSTVQVAREQATEVGHSAQQAGQHVAQTAAEQAKEVASEAGRQARDLVGEARTQVREQAGTQQQRAVESLRALAGELRQMAGKSEQSGMATELAHTASDRVEGLAGWLDGREPGAMLEEVRSYARRRPGTFLLGAALAGVVAGRLTRAVAAKHGDSGSGSGSAQQLPTYNAGITRGSAGTGYLEPASASAAIGYGEDGYATSGRSGYAEPGYADGGTRSGYAQQGSAEPGYAEAGYVEPGYVEPGYVEPGYVEPGYAEPAAPTGYPAGTGLADEGYDSPLRQPDTGYERPDQR